MIAAQHKQAFEDTFARARVQRRDDKMTRERSPHGEVGGFFVADLADDQHLGILAEQVTGGFGKIEPAGFVHFGLHYAGNDLLGGIFDRDNMPATLLGEPPETGINGGGFAAAGGASQEQ